jgi:hypothetical protein
MLSFKDGNQSRRLWINIRKIEGKSKNAMTFLMKNRRSLEGLEGEGSSKEAEIHFSLLNDNECIYD